MNFLDMKATTCWREWVLCDKPVKIGAKFSGGAGQCGSCDSCRDRASCPPHSGACSGSGACVVTMMPMSLIHLRTLGITCQRAVARLQAACDAVQCPPKLWP